MSSALDTMAPQSLLRKECSPPTTSVSEIRSPSAFLCSFACVPLLLTLNQIELGHLQNKSKPSDAASLSTKPAEMTPVLQHKRPYSMRSSTRRNENEALAPLLLSGITLRANVANRQTKNQVSDTLKTPTATTWKDASSNSGSVETRHDKRKCCLVSTSTGKKKRKATTLHSTCHIAKKTKRSSAASKTKTDSNDKENWILGTPSNNLSPSELSTKNTTTTTNVNDVGGQLYQGRVTRSKSSSNLPFAATTVSQPKTPFWGKKRLLKEKKPDSSSRPVTRSVRKARANSSNTKPRLGSKSRKTIGPATSGNPTTTTTVVSQSAYRYDPNGNFKPLDSRRFFDGMYVPVHIDLSAVRWEDPIHHGPAMTPVVRLAFRGAPTSVSPITPVSKVNDIITCKGPTKTPVSSMHNDKTPVTRNPRHSFVGQKVPRSSTAISQTKTEIPNDVESPSELAVICGVSPSCFEPVPVHAFSSRVEFEDWIIDYLDLAVSLPMDDCLINCTQRVQV
jgi:hypothetical protein